MQFALWCLAGVPLMMGADLRSLAPEYKELMQNPDLLRIDQDAECRSLYLIRKGSVTTSNPEPKEGEFPWKQLPDTSYTFIRHLSDREFALAYVNFSPADATIHCEMADIGLPVSSGYALSMRDVFTGEQLSPKTDFFNPRVPAHDMKLYLCRLVPVHG
jgi:alpha-galactosidase